MLGKPSSGKRPPASGDSVAGNSGLLHEIHALSRALSLEPTSRRPNLTSTAEPKPKSPSSSKKEKKPSFWNWKPLKALSHIRQRRFDCLFSLHVHSVENLPPILADSALSVHWKRTTDPASSASGTSSVQAFDGVAEFEETLTYRCSVYGARRSSNNAAAKFEPRQFLIYVSFVDFPGLELGKHLVDLTRLLPLTLEELKDDENSSGKWSTSFRLTGKGRGASLNVSFGFSLIGDGSSESTSEKKVLDILNLKMDNEGSHGRSRRKGRRWGRSYSVDDVKVLHEVLPSSKSDASSLENAVEEDREVGDLEVNSSKPEPVDSEEDVFIKKKISAVPESVKEQYQNESEESEFMVIEQGVEISTKDHLSATGLEGIELQMLDQGATFVPRSVDNKLPNVDENCDVDYEVHRLFPKDYPAAAEDQEPVSDVLLMEELEVSEAQCLETMEINQMSCGDDSSKNEGGNLQSKAIGFDDSSKAVASEFLNMLGIDHSPFGLSSDSDPESPRERLWKQFEEETVAAGRFLFGLDSELEFDDASCEKQNLADISEGFDLSPMVHEAEREFQKATLDLSHNSRAKLLEEEETEALMIKWGLNEKIYQSSPPGSRSAFGSPIYLQQDEPFELPPLGEGLGPSVQTKDGGFLRSMSQFLFRNSKNNASLIMQVSRPVVIPTDLGSGIVEILQGLASLGIEKLSFQSKKLMPLDDVTGKTIQQIAWEAAPAFDACRSTNSLQNLHSEADVVSSERVYGRRKKVKGLNLSSSSSYALNSEYVSIEELAPLAMDNIEALSIEGLRIQSGMTHEEAPSNFCSHSIGDNSTNGKAFSNSFSLGLDGTAGLRLLDVKGGGDDVDGLMDLSITLDEWMRLDSGMVDDEDHMSDITLKLLAAHHASPDLIRGGFKEKRSGGQKSGRRWGLLSNNFTVALMVQLRDPLRNYEPVGTPMLALVQVERVFMPPKPKMCNTISVTGNSEEDDEPETNIKQLVNENGKEEEENVIPQFKITEVHVAGLKTEPNKKKVWGNPLQQQSGSRWLLANGMGKSNKQPFMKSKAVSRPSPAAKALQSGDALWSISSDVHETGSKLKGIFAFSPHKRNPNVILPT